LARSIRGAPAIPLFYGGSQPIQTVWIDDIGDAVARMIRQKATGLFRVAEAEPVRIREFYLAVAEKLGVRRLAVPLPGTPALWVLKAAEALSLKLPMHSDNLLGLKHLIRYDVLPDLKRLELRPRSMRESLELVDWRTLCS
jgi:nucleoside-diphosphate-sugar epimerase